MDDEQLIIEQLRKGDLDALTHTFEIYSDRIYRLALSLLRNEQSADGVVQDTFIALIENIAQFEGKSSIGTWLYRIAYNNCMERLRKLKSKPSVELHEDHDDNQQLPIPEHYLDWQNIPENILTSNEVMTQVEQAIQSLSPALRAVFVLRDMEELSTEETAQALDIKISTVKVRLHRARLLLREHLAAYLESTAV